MPGLSPAEARVQAQVLEACTNKSALTIQGSGSKHFLGRRLSATPVSTLEMNQVLSYEPSELVVRVQSGFSLCELDALLAEKRQRLAFEPLLLGKDLGDESHRGGTVGGMVATALAGARRPWSGGVRDAMLGLNVINGQGEYLRFGGQVMKNVAGYDVSRMFCGSMGCLGVVAEVSLKVLPMPEASATVVLNWSVSESLARMAEWQRQMHPVSGLAHDGNRAYLRLEGSKQGLESFLASKQLSGGIEESGQETLSPSPEHDFWCGLRKQQLPFFQTDADEGCLWRLSLPPGTDLSSTNLGVGARYLMDWAGAQYWIRSVDESALRMVAEQHRGDLYAFDATLDREFPAMHPVLMTLHRNLKKAYDPHGVFNSGRMYAAL